MELRTFKLQLLYRNLRASLIVSHNLSNENRIDKVLGATVGCEVAR